MKKVTYLFWVTCFVISVQANVESLENKLNNEKLTYTEQISICIELCRYYMGNDIDKLFQYTEKGLEIIQKEKNKAIESRFISYLGDCYDAWGKQDSALILYQKALELALNSDNEDEKAYAYCTIGTFYTLRYKYIIAMEYYMKALSFCENTKGSIQYINILNSIGGTYRQLSNNEHAVFYLEQAKNMAEKIGLDREIMYASYDLGLIALEDKETDKALEYIQKTIKYSHMFNDKELEIASIQALAYIYCDGLKDCNKAEEYALKSLNIAEDFGDQRIVCFAWITLSDIYLAQRNYSKSETAALKALETDSLFFDNDGSTILNITMANAFMGNEDKAFFYFWKTRDLYKEYIKKSLRETIADLEVKYETEKKELQIASLEKEKQLYIWLGIAGASVFILVLGIFFFRHRLTIQKQKVAEQQREIAEQQQKFAEQKVKQLEQEKQLVATKSLLEGETNERSRLARDLHDGLGGILSVVKLNLSEIKNCAILDETDYNHFSKAQSMLDQSIGELRRVAHHLMPQSLIRYGLAVSLEDYCLAIPNAHYQYFGTEERLNDQLEVVLYRCAYEIINNAVKYAQASVIHVQLIIDNGLISLTVHDDGIGFDLEKISSGSGLDNIRTRVSAYNGKMNIHSVPGNGTEISIEIENNNPVTDGVN